MSLSINKDDSIFHLTSEELNIKSPKRRKSIQHTIKPNHILQNPAKLNNSISKLNNIIKKTQIKKNDKTIIKEYLHSHQFALKRAKSKRITINPFRNKFNKSFQFNKSE